ncbi:MAG: ATP-binding protein [Actinomycetes bacterium]
MQLRGLERWISLVRLVALPFALAAVALAHYPAGWELWAWVTTGLFAAGAVVLFAFARLEVAARHQIAQSVVAQVFDTAVVTAYVLVYSFERGLPIQQLLYIDLAAACVRFQLVGGLVLAAVSAPIVAGFERLRSREIAVPYSWKLVGFQTAFELVIALIVAWLVRRLAAEGAHAEARATEAEALRDELRHRADLANAVNRCARALASSLEVGEAFGAFMFELRALLPYDRVTIVLAEDEQARVMASTGLGVESQGVAVVEHPIGGTLLEQVVATGRAVHRRNLDAAQYTDERELSGLRVRSSVAVPLDTGTCTIGMLAVYRCESDAFHESDVQFVGLLGRFVAAAAQNIRAYEAERETVEELRRLSTMRADFVSLVSHEVRTPLAAVIGSARTLQKSWRELDPDQRDAFLALIANETDRLAAMVGEVLDSARIGAGTFSYTFAPVDVCELVRESVAAAALGGAGSRVVATIPDPVPLLRADGARLRQVITNLVDNALKYGADGAQVNVRIASVNGTVRVEVADHGPGIAPEDAELIFERFGRVRGTSFKPGTGLGLYIARGIAEAHGGTLTVASKPGEGATFVLALPTSG